MNQTLKTDLPTPQTKRIFKFKTKLQTKLDSFNKLSSVHLLKQYIKNTQLHVPGKINFHELLSLPLEKQIQKENSLKQNQTFCLKFQPDFQKRESNKQQSRQSLNKVGNKNYRFLNRKNITAQKGQRVKKSSQNEEFVEMKQAAKTMYFRPIGKIARNLESENEQRRSLQLTRNIRNKQNQKLQLGMNVYKDKLLMLLQIRKQQRNQRKSKSSLGNAFNSYRQINKLNMTEGIREKIDQSKSYRSYRRNINQELGNTMRLRRANYSKKQTQTTVNPNQLSPWYLMENVEEF